MEVEPLTVLIVFWEELSPTTTLKDTNTGPLVETAELPLPLSQEKMLRIRSRTEAVKINLLLILISYCYISLASYQCSVSIIGLGHTEYLVIICF